MARDAARPRPPRALETAPRGSRRPEPAALLLATGLTTAQVQALLEPYGFRDFRRADRDLQAMAGEPRPRQLLAKFLGQLLRAASETADPDQALTHWDRFLGTAIDRVQLFEYLAASPRMVDLLCAVFGNSPALAQTLIRDPALVYWLAEQRVLNQRSPSTALARDLHAALSTVKTEELQLEALRRFKRREMLRIGVRDLLRLAPVEETIAALSDLAEVLIQAAYRIVEVGLRSQYGRPCHRTKAGRWVETGFAVIAMGKLGGGELNYSSDVDLLYVYESGEGHTVHESQTEGGASSPVPNEEYFEYLARGLTKAIAEVTQEGYVFRVDLRLRPEGRVGPLARSLKEYERYYRARGQDWERLALLKAWPVAGSRSVGRAFLRLARSFVFRQSPSTPDALSNDRVLEQVKSVKGLIDARMAARGLQRRNVKLGVGGIREVEFIVQTIQVLCGRTLQDICDRSTLGALKRFGRHKLLTSRDRAALSESYLFLRDVEHKLQMVHDLQTHALPRHVDELTRCAIRLGYPGRVRSVARVRFVRDYARHTARVHRIFRNLVENPRRSRLLKAVKARLRRG